MGSVVERQKRLQTIAQWAETWWVNCAALLQLLRYWNGSRLPNEVNSAKLLGTQKVEFSLEKGSELFAGGGKKDLPHTCQSNVA